MKWLLLFFIIAAWAQEAPPECKDTQQIVEMQRNTALTWHSISEAKLTEMRVELERYKKENVELREEMKRRIDELQKQK
jgi:hypothetical protein